MSMTLAGVLLVAPAHADEPPGDAPAAAASAASAASEEARAHHRRGLELYDEGDYRLALVELQRAYSLGQNYKILFNIGQVHFQLNAYAKARLTLEQYLAEGGAAIPEKRRADVEKDLATLRARTATLTVRVNVPDAVVTLNDAAAGKAPLEAALVDAGVLRVQITRAGYAPVVREVTLAGGDTEVVTIDLLEAVPPASSASLSPVAPAPPPPSAGLPREAVAGWVITGVLLAGTVATGIVTSVSASNYESKRKTPIPGTPAEARAELEGDRSRVNTLAVATDVVGITTLVAGAVSLYLTLRERPRNNDVQVRVQGSRAMLSIGF